MKSILALLLFCFFSLSCKKNGVIPFCINERIEQIKAQPKGSGASEIHEYKYKGKDVYLFIAPCCDAYNPLYDKDCNYMCSPTGGLAGSGDGTCPDFTASAKYIKLVWRDPR